MRGFAALWVVMVHSCGPFLGDNMRYVKLPLYAFSIRGQLGVVLFFVISGYCITASAYGALTTGKPVWRYGYERVRRIYPPYLATLVLALLAIVVVDLAQSHHLIGMLHHDRGLSPSPRYWMGNFLLLQSELKVPCTNVVSWSLCYEVSFYVIIGLFLFGAKRLALRWGMLAGTVFFVASIGVSTMLSLSCMLTYKDAAFPFDLWHQFSLGSLLFFVLESGPATISGYSTTFRNFVWGNCAVVAVLTLFFVAYCQVGDVDVAHPSSKVRSSLCLLFCVFLIGLHRFDGTVSKLTPVRPWMWLGGFSYSLYLAHTIIRPFVDVTCRRAGLVGDRYWIAFWIQVVMAIAFGRLVYLLVERHFISKRQLQRLASEHAA